jgi:hypothetical protein
VMHEARSRSSPKSEQQVGHIGRMPPQDAQQGPPTGMHAMARIAFSGMLFRPRRALPAGGNLTARGFGRS